MPELYMQEAVDETGNSQHIIVDGQQRIRACLEFLAGEYSLDENEAGPWANMFFDDLTSEDKRSIFNYSFLVRILPEVTDEEIRGIFQRINRNVMSLNFQELRQSTYSGPFLKTVQEIADYQYWSTAGIFTPMNMRRMLDAEYISELVIAILHGHQNKKETIDLYYQTYEENFDQRDETIAVFQKVLFQIEQILPDIKNTRWKKKSDFYSLFIFLASIADRLPFGVLTAITLLSALDDFAGAVTSLLSSSSQLRPDNYSQAVTAYASSIRASSDIGNRRRRHEALIETLMPVVSQAATTTPHTILPLEEASLFEA